MKAVKLTNGTVIIKTDTGLDFEIKRKDDRVQVIAIIDGLSIDSVIIPGVKTGVEDVIAKTIIDSKVVDLNALQNLSKKKNKEG